MYPCSLTARPAFSSDSPSTAAPGREQHRFGFERLAALHHQVHAGRRGLHLYGPFVQPELHAKRGKPHPESLGNLRIEERQQAVPAIHQRDLHAERDEYGRVLAANHAAADYREALRDAIHPQERVRVEDPDVVESYFWRTVRSTSSGNENHIATQLPDAIRTGNGYGVGLFERSPAADELDVMKGEILQDALALHFNHFSLVVHEIMDGQILFKGIVDAAETALFETGKVECGFTKRLAGDGAGVDAASAHMLGALDDGNTFAKIGSLRTGLFSCRAAANDDQIEIFAKNHHNLPLELS